MDSEEQFESEEENGSEASDATTMVLGQWDKAQAKEGGKSDVEPADIAEGEETHAADTLRATYWAVVHEEQKKIKKKNPKMSAKEVLKLAREAWAGCSKHIFLSVLVICPLLCMSWYGFEV